MTLLAVERAVDGVAGVRKRGDELAVEIGIVLDDQKAPGRVCIPRVGREFASGRSRGRERKWC